MIEELSTSFISNLRQRGAAFDKNELHNNIAPILAWNRQHEVPDVIAFQDVEQFSRRFAEELAYRATRYVPDNLFIFPYPKFVAGAPPTTRKITVLQFADALMLRTAVGRFIGQTDSLISDRVFSYRLAPSRVGFPWAFKDIKDSWYGFVGRTVNLLKTKRYGNLCQTDVAQYFPSINIKTLENLLLWHSCDARAVRCIFEILEHWHLFSGLRGLPISLEASSALGNVYLEGLDRDLINAGAKHFRYMDDMSIFGETSAVCDALIEMLDAKLRAMGLERSERKTHFFNDPELAIAHLQNAKLSYLGAILKDRPDLGRRELYFAFDELLEAGDEIELSAFHYILKVLKGNRDPYGCKLMAARPRLMNFDPKLSADYLKIAFERGQFSAVIDACMERLRQPPDEHYEALDLHLLRVLAGTHPGDAEGREFQQIATDKSRRWPVRNFAWHAYAASSVGSDSVLMEAAREEQQPEVRRAIIAALKQSKFTRKKSKNFLRHAAHHYKESRYTLEWVRAAA